MNKIIQITVGSLIIICQLSAIEIHRPRYLVANQPIPYVVSTTIDDRQNLNMDSYLIPVRQNESTLLIFGGGHMNDYIDEIDKSIAIEGLYGSFFGTGNLGRNGFWITYQSVGWFGNDIDVKDNVSLKYFQISQFGIKWNPRLSVKGGILYSSNFERPVILPLLGIAYSKNNWILDVTLPIMADFRYILRDNLHAVVTGKMNAQSYLINEYDDILDYSNIAVYAGLEFMLWKWTWLTAGINNTSGRSTTFEKVQIPQELSGISSFSVGLIIRVEI